MEKLLTRKEAAGILGISIATLDAARTSGQIAFVQYVENGHENSKVTMDIYAKVNYNKPEQVVLCS